METKENIVAHYDNVIVSYYKLIESYKVEIAKLRTQADRMPNEIVNVNIEQCTNMVLVLEKDIVRLRDERASYF